ncbi:unnamed protein product [Lampetra planeri]
MDPLWPPARKAAFEKKNMILLPIDRRPLSGGPLHDARLAPRFAPAVPDGTCRLTECTVPSGTWTLLHRSRRRRVVASGVVVHATADAADKQLSGRRSALPELRVGTASSCREQRTSASACLHLRRSETTWQQQQRER